MLWHLFLASPEYVDMPIPEPTPWIEEGFWKQDNTFEQSSSLGDAQQQLEGINLPNFSGLVEFSAECRWIPFRWMQILP